MAATPDRTTASAAINALYRKHLGRDAEPSGLNYWLNSITKGASIADVEANIKRSDEYVSAQTTPVEPEMSDPLRPPPPTLPPTAPPRISRQDVDGLYKDLFGRIADDAGAEYWMGEVASGKIEASDLARHLEYAANTTEKGRSELAFGKSLKEENDLSAPYQEQQTKLIEALQAQQEAQQASYERQQASQQEFLDRMGTGLQGKGGSQQQSAPVIDSPAPTPQQSIQQPEPVNAGYYQNPYSSGYGMGYQDPYASQQYMPRRGLMGPTGFGGKGGYSPQPMYPTYQPFQGNQGMGAGKGQSLASPPINENVLSDIPGTSPPVIVEDDFSSIMPDGPPPVFVEPEMSDPLRPPTFPVKPEPGIPITGGPRPSIDALPDLGNPSPTPYPYAAPSPRPMGAGKGGYSTPRPQYGYSSAPAKGGYRAPMYPPVYQPMYQPRGGYYGGGYYG